MSLLNKIGDNYHRHVYSKITKFNKHLTDKTNFSTNDIALLLAPYIPEMFAVAITYELFFDSKETIESAGIKNFRSFGIILGAAFLSSLTNIFRTPVREKINMETQEIDLENEINYTIDKLNELSDSEELSFDEVAKETKIALEDYLEEKEGYCVSLNEKIKKSMVPGHASKIGILGLFSPFTHEISIIDDTYLESIAHERAHQAGYVREEEAQFVGYASMLHSQNRSLQYLAYRQRLWMNESWKLKDLSNKNLNRRTLSELKNIIKLRRKRHKNLSKYDKFKYNLMDAARSLTLISSRQGNIEEAYNSRPLEMISSYDPPK